MFSKILHFGCLTIRRKTPRGSRWFRQARKLQLTACGGRDSTALGVIRTLSRIDRFFQKNNLPMAEARDFHCYSHVF